MAAAAILNFENSNFWSRDCNRVQYLMQCTKFHQNRTIFHWEMAIKRFSKWRPSANLDFTHLQFLSRSPCQRAVLLPHTTFRWTAGRWFMAKKAIFKMAVAAILNFKNFNFWSVDCFFNIWCVPNFIKIGQFFTEIWRFNDFKDFNFWSRDCHGFNICCFGHKSSTNCPISAKSDNWSMIYG